MYMPLLILVLILTITIIFLDANRLDKNDFLEKYEYLLEQKQIQINKLASQVTYLKNKEG